MLRRAHKVTHPVSTSSSGPGPDRCRCKCRQRLELAAATNNHWQAHNLSLYRSRGGSSGAKPLRVLTSVTILWQAEPASIGSPGTTSQCENTICGCACPDVAPRIRSNPKDSATGKRPLTVNIGVPGRWTSSVTCPRRWCSHEYTVPRQVSGHETSTTKIGSISRGAAVYCAPRRLLRAAGITLPAPRWRASWWRTTSRIVKPIPRMLSSVRTPSLLTHWNAETMFCLPSMRFCTPCVPSRSTFGPLKSGPNAHTLRAMSASHP
mmetsp:Transcript_38546/g.79074  ORF Transcript_38546/g.79074 Transcript_38546/m.79074 type:complete len:264 (+) Transcript_38546:550-1341(+)